MPSGRPPAARSPVSILTQPEGWVPFRDLVKDPNYEIVSILTQPEGWVPC